MRKLYYQSPEQRKRKQIPKLTTWRMKITNVWVQGSLWRMSGGITSTSFKSLSHFETNTFLSWDGNKSSEKRNKVCVGQVLKFSESELTADQFVYNSGSYRQTIKLPTMPPPWKETDGEICGISTNLSFPSIHVILLRDKISLWHLLSSTGTKYNSSTHWIIRFCTKLWNT